MNQNDLQDIANVAVSLPLRPKRSHLSGQLQAPQTAFQPIYVLLDSSYSMTAPYNENLTRMQIAEHATQDLIKRLAESSKSVNFAIGVGTFNSSAREILPIRPMKQICYSAGISCNGTGTYFGSGLELAIAALRASLDEAPFGMRKQGVILMLTDGENNIDPSKAFALGDQCKEDPSLRLCCVYFSRRDSENPEVVDFLRKLVTHEEDVLTAYTLEAVRQFFYKSSTTLVNN